MIVALHGAIGSVDDWKPLPVDGDWHCVNLWKFLQCCPKSLPELGRAINNEFPKSGHTLVAYSMGGRIALHALLDANSNWDKAVIISAHTGLKNENERSVRRSLDAEWASKALSMHWQTFIEEWNQQGILADSESPDRSDLIPWRRQIARSFIDWSTGNQDDLLPLLHQIEIPVLWITGAKDTKFTKVAEQAVEALPNATHLSIPDCGHRVPFERRDFLYREISNFINS
jgi:2-succinyl-6-hydroxy-2,4-cyclohexadiene-1-carboxylate synthase